MPSPDLRNSPQTSQSLLLRLCDGNDHESWQLFFAIYSPVLREYFQRRGLQAADSDDLVQEVLASVVKAMRDSQYDRAKGRFRSWLGTVAANRLSNFFRRRACYANLVQVTPDNVAYIDPDSDWVELFSKHLFRAACERIRPLFELQTWESFQLTWIDNVPAQEVANRLSIPIHSVYVNKSRVLQRLKDEVETLAEDCAVPE
jgi:RNA polymerase sigma-70 factor (ECF subfamily)